MSGVHIGGRDAESLEPLIAFIAKYIVEPRHAKQLTGVAHRLLDLYGTAVRTSLPGCQYNVLKVEVLGCGVSLRSSGAPHGQSLLLDEDLRLCSDTLPCDQCMRCICDRWARLPSCSTC